jgi:serine/threonine-protein kinase
MSNILDRLKDALADRYAIEREIGAGGMATVYLARDLKHDRQVAVKVLRPDLAAVMGADRFLREIKIAAQLHHPHILPLYDSGEADDFLYYVMPYIEGQSLREKLAREGELPIAEAVKILREVVDALASAHKHGVVHRDIKPDNVMLSENHALVTDFGVAKAVSEATGRQALTTVGVAIGTPAYMAPEQAAAEPHIDHRADIYSLGALAYELLTGRPPFTGATQQMVLAAHVTQVPEPVTNHRPAVPPELAQVVMRCLEKKPADRWQSAAELLPHFETLPTPSGGVEPTAAVPAASSSQKKSSTPWLVGIGAAAALVIAAIGLTRGGGGDAASPAAGADVGKSIAVLAFDDMSPQGDQEYFSDGIAEEILNALTKIPNLKVAARTSSFAFKGTTANAQAIGKQLGVSTVLEGSVRKEGNTIRVTAQLIDTDDGFHLWSGTYTRELHSVFAIQDEISRAIVSQLEITLAGGDQAPLVAVATDNTEAYDEYLRGRYQWNRRTEESLFAAVDHFRRAIDLDSGFALAYAGLADASVVFPAWSQTVDPIAMYAQGEAAARQALALDSTLAGPHAALGFAKYFGRHEWAEGERELRRAVDLNLAYATAHQWLGELLALVGRLDEAEAEIRTAYALDPLSLIINVDVGSVLLYQRRYDAAIEQLERTRELAPEWAGPHVVLASARALTNEYGQAATSVTRRAEAFGIDTTWVEDWAAAAREYRSTGRPVLDFDLDDLSDYSYLNAIAYGVVGNREKTLFWLERSRELRQIPDAKVNPVFDFLHGDPEFVALLERMGLN